MPRAGRVPITIGGVVSTVTALTNYMPVKQDPITGQATIESMNLQIMNATQLAVIFTLWFPDASAKQVTQATSAFIAERVKTEFGLNYFQFICCLVNMFGNQLTPTIDFSPSVPLSVRRQAFFQHYVVEENNNAGLSEVDKDKQVARLI